MNIHETRTKIDEVDREIVSLFQKRMKLCGEIGEYKAKQGLPLTDHARELEKLFDVSGMVPEDMRRYMAELYSTIFDISKAYQAQISGSNSDLGTLIGTAIENTPQEFPERATIACQVVEGAFSQIACERLFSLNSGLDRPVIYAVGSVVIDPVSDYAFHNL